MGIYINNILGYVFKKRKILTGKQICMIILKYPNNKRKICRAPEETMFITDILDVFRFQAIIECDSPHPYLYSFMGLMKCFKFEKEISTPLNKICDDLLSKNLLFETPLSIKNILLRG